MKEVNKKGIYELYEIFKDYNRIAILTNLYNKELTSNELSLITGLNPVIVFHQLEYLRKFKIIGKDDSEDPKYKISDQTMKMIICRMNNYTEKRRTR